MERLRARLLGSIALVALITGPALAADIAVKAPIYKAPPPVYVSSWTGFYAGIGVGGRWMDSDWTTTAAFFPNGVAFPFTTDPNALFSSGSARVSGYVGYN